MAQKNRDREGAAFGIFTFPGGEQLS